jgi:mycoredoxin
VTSDIQVYGTDWCGLTFGVREYLTNARLAYDFHDVDRDPAAHELMLAMTDGRRRFPLVVVSEYVLVNPSRADLQHALNEYR